MYGNQVSCTGRNSYTLNKIEETDCRKEISAPSDSFYDIITDDDFGFLSIRLNSSTTKWEGKIALNTNCSLLPEGKFLTESQILTNNVEVNL